jgi:hypothetical protein
MLLRYPQGYNRRRPLPRPSDFETPPARKTAKIGLPPKPARKYGEQPYNEEDYVVPQNVKDILALEDTVNLST